MTQTLSPPPHIIAHRGACGYAPENTIAAFSKAHELGTQWVEFDVVLSKDEVPVIFHDASTTRTTNLPDHDIAKLTLEEIKKLDAGSWFNPEFAGERIPTFAEVLLFLREHHMQPCIEIKPTRGSEQRTVIQMLKNLQEYWPQQKEFQPLISSFSLKSLQYLREALPQAPLALICKRWRKPYAQILKELNCHSIHLNASELTASHVAAIRGLGYEVFAYTVDTPMKAESLFRWGVQAIFSNYPDRFAKL